MNQKQIDRVVKKLERIISVADRGSLPWATHSQRERALLRSIKLAEDAIAIIDKAKAVTP